MEQSLVVDIQPHLSLAMDGYKIVPKPVSGNILRGYEVEHIPLRTRIS